MSLPEVASQEEWLAARKELLAKEKELTRTRDSLNAQRRRLPMVEVDKDYVFEGPEGEARLVDLFDGRRQLIVRHFMFDPTWDDGCPSCTAVADEVSNGLLEHLNARDTTYATVSRAPLAKIEDYKARRAGRFRGTRLTAATSTMTSTSRCVFHTYSVYGRGAEMRGGSYYHLDLTALGRQEEWEEPKGRASAARGANPDFAA